MSTASFKDKGTKSKILRERSVSESKDGNCVLCVGKASYFAVGMCDHPICYKCSARMRVLSKQFYCAACRAEMDQVVFCKNVKRFTDFKVEDMAQKSKYGIRFENKTVKDAYEALVSNACAECGEKEAPFGSLQDLKAHIRKVHEKQFCQICIDNLSLFSRELKLYTKRDLVHHRKEGDKDERSHRGHPECKFCNDRFFDNDALLLHLRKNHFWCHFCEHDGKQDYYDVYGDLRKHFSSAHYLCDEGSCRDEKFTSVFRDKIDYQAHKLAAHGKKLSKLEAKEARKIDIDYNFRGRQQQSGGLNGSDYEDVRKEEHSKRRGAGGARHRYHRDHRGTLNYYDYENVEKDRKEFQGKTRRHEAEEVNNRDLQHVGMAAAAASLSSSEPDIHNRLREVNMNDSDDDVIGLSERLDKPSEPRQSRKQEKPRNVQEVDQHPTEDLSAIIRDKPKAEVSPPKEPVHRPVVPKKEDFLSLPGANNIQQSIQKKREEAFPALGPPIKVKQPPKSSAPTRAKQGWTDSINGIPIKTKKKGKTKSWSQQSGRSKVSSEADFPTLSSGKPSSSNGSNLNVRKPPGFSVEENPEKSASSSVSKSEGLKKDSTSVKVKTPPGLQTPPTKKQSTKSHPPGLRKQTEEPSVQKETAKSQPPGFEKQSNKPSAKKETAKSQPPGLRKQPDEHSLRMERNMRLLAMLQTYLDDFNLSVFKTLSGEFRRELKNAEEYYMGIRELLGENLKYVFSELVALLPDERKQQQLLLVHNNAKVLEKQWKEVQESAPPTSYATPAVWGAANVNKEPVEITMSRCGECGQTFPKDKALEHMESHSEAFPALPTDVKKKRMRNFAPINNSYRQIRLENAWGK